MIYNIVSFFLIGGATILLIVLTVAILSSPVLGEEREQPDKEAETAGKERL